MFKEELTEIHTISSREQGEEHFTVHFVMLLFALIPKSEKDRTKTEN